MQDVGITRPLHWTQNVTKLRTVLFIERRDYIDKDRQIEIDEAIRRLHQEEKLICNTRLQNTVPKHGIL